MALVFGAKLCCGKEPHIHGDKSTDPMTYHVSCRSGKCKRVSDSRPTLLGAIKNWNEQND